MEPDYFSGQASDEPEFGEVTFADIDSTQTVSQGHDADDRFSESSDEDSEEEFTVEIELEPEPEVEIELDEVSVEPEVQEDWLDAVARLLDSFGTKGGKVKFANGPDGDDPQSHYDLGLAFMEMGLFDESFKEFRQAAADSSRRFACYVFQGVCLREKGDLENAEKVLRSLVNPSLSVEDACTVKYELALTCQAAGNAGDYLALLNDIDKSDRTFRDVHDRLAAHAEDDFTGFTDDDLKGLNF